MTEAFLCSAGFSSKDLHSAQAAQPSRARGGHGPPCPPPCPPLLSTVSLLPCLPSAMCPAPSLHALLLAGSSFLCVCLSLSQKCFASVPPAVFCLFVPSPHLTSLSAPHPLTPLCFSPPPPLLSLDLSLSLLFSFPPPLSLSHILGEDHSTRHFPQRLRRSRLLQGHCSPSPSPIPAPGAQHPAGGGVPQGTAEEQGAKGPQSAAACSPPPPSSHRSQGKAKQLLCWGVFATLGKSGSEKHWVQPLFLK